MTNALVYNGTVIRDRNEMLSLTDMWRAAGSDPSKRPAEWARSAQARDLTEFLESTMGISHSEAFQVVTGGSDPGTWAHWHIGFAYAKYLSPEFHVWCNQVVRAHMEGKLVAAPVEEDTDLLIYRGFQEAMKRLGEYEPKARAYDRIAASEGSQNLTETAKILRIPRNILINKLHRMHWIYRRPGGENSDWVGYDYHTKNGDLEHVFHEIIRSGIRMQICQVRVTARGIAKLSKIFTNKTDDDDSSGSPPAQPSLNLALGVIK